jgi:isopenicillin N synthase-like dioxygenase
MTEANDIVPVIDFASFLAGGAREKAQVAQDISHACRGIGFFYLKNHGIDSEKLTDIFEASRAFFALPAETRMAMQASRDHYRGYMPLSSRTDSKTGLTTLYEAFKMQIELPSDDPDMAAGKPLHQPNKWPAGLPDWRHRILDYWDAMIGLSGHLLSAFAIALDRPPNFFHAFYRKPLAQLSLLHYPPQPPHAPADQWGIEPHTDTGAFTILAQDATGGLQVKHKTLGWIDAPPMPGCFVVNIGDMMNQWTSGLFASTPHRVVNKTGKDRYSIPFFMNPDFDAVITPFDTASGIAPIHVGPFMVRVYTANWKS